MTLPYNKNRFLQVNGVAVHNSLAKIYYYSMSAAIWALIPTLSRPKIQNRDRRTN